MLDEKAKAEFLRLGVSKYPDAWATVDAFENEIFSAIKAAFEEKAPWAGFEPRLVNGSVDFKKLIGRELRWMSGSVIGTLASLDGPQLGEINLGVFWNPPHQSHSVVAACAPWLGKSWMAMRWPEQRQPPLEVGPLYNKNERRLYVGLSRQTELREAFTMLLDAVDNALATSSSERSTTT
jgi:hypothetical protein